jgi:hypothetical protein
MSTTTATLTQNPAALLINSLSPKQRAILYCTILTKKEDIENELSEHINNHRMHPKLANRQSEFYRWYIKECKEMMHLLFAECFITDMEILRFFQKDLPLVGSGR